MFPTAEWKEHRAVDAAAEALEGPLAEAGVEDVSARCVLARLLSLRGVGPAALAAFLNPAPSALMSPESLPGIREAAGLILDVVRDGGEVVVFGDYDADGVSASAILVGTLRKLGAVKVSAFIPDRFMEGYGMTAAALERLFREHRDARLIVTVDNGISSVKEVADLRARGVKVVVTDHHLPGQELPAADVLVNPRVAAPPEAEALCGAGVAFFLAGALATEAAARGTYGGGRLAGPLLVLAGVATVADIVPLVGQNRLLVACALANFAKCAPVGLKELLLRAERTTRDLSARDLAFLVAPRLNAAGRMASAREAYDLVVTTDREEARMLATRVDARNAERKTIEERMDREARAQAGLGEGAPFAAPALVVCGPTAGEAWHPGVAGIVAARLLETVKVPVAVIVPAADGTGHGSARAPDGYNVHDALASCAAALVRFGGHAAAGGFTVKAGALADFRRLFAAACAAQRAAAPAAAIEFDGWLEPGEVTMELCAALRRLEPFGAGNQEPVFGVRGVTLRDVRPLGADEKHLACEFAERGLPRATWWRHGADAEELRKRAYGRFDILFTVEVSDFGGEEPHPELRLVDIRPAALN